MKKKQLLIGGGIAVILLLLFGVWNLWFSATKVAFINYQVISLGQISKANDNSFIKISELSTDDLNRLTSYDMIFINAMGLRITEEQRAQIQKAADGGLPILTTAATNPANKIISLDSIQADTLKHYLSNGGRRNYRSMLNYVRVYIDKKRFSVSEPEAVVKRADDVLYHMNPKSPEDEELGFNTVAGYNIFLQNNGLWKENAPRIIVTGPMGEPSGLIAKLEETGNMVYPIRSMHSFIQNHGIDSVRPSAIINMAHGRMGDYIVDYLAKQNIPLFSPLNVNRLVEEWESDKMGMNGGFMSQSIVTPEIDGAIRPFALFGHYKDEEGLQRAYAIPERLETFVETVNNYITLQRKSNSEKRVAIYYYKGPGQNALTAGGMEVVPSLYNLLQRMKREGYKVDGLPTSPKELEQMIQSQGAVFGPYAEGAFDRFMETGKPELITKEQYESWIKKSIRSDMYAEVVAANGEFPGAYMTTSDGRLGVARLQFGNVVLLPQNAAGSGDNAFKVVHGTNAAPPHTYIASYLWTQFGFKADALIHFGTHGSLEFTPRKQVALCSNDWSDRLVGALPHFYIYSIGNVGEGMIAKRRSYAGLQSYLTPPFMESSVRAIYRELTEAVKTYNNLLPADGQAVLSTGNKEALNRASLMVKKLTVKMGIHRELGLDSLLTVPYAEEDIQRIENFAEELANEKITGQLYTMGIPYEPIRITSSVYAMATEPIAYSLLALDKLRNRADGQVEKHRTLFTQRYLEPARDLVTRLLADPSLVSDELICRITGITSDELAKAHEINKSRNTPQGMMAMMMALAEEAPAEAKTHADMSGGIMQADQSVRSKRNSISESMKEKMKEIAKGMNPEKAMELAKRMGASPEALKKMETGMYKSHAVGMNTLAKDTVTMKTTSRGKREKADSDKFGGMEAMMKVMMSKKKEYSKEEINFALAVMEVERTLKNVGNYKSALLESPERELTSMVNALNGGYTQPSPGGDPIANPNTLPTGRNLFAINAEETPSESAWEKGKQLADNTIEMYRRRHNDSIPRKVSYTLWSGEFIETGGATIAQVLYMLGVEPIRDTFGRVTDLRLIPSAELGRPRIDVVVQTSGQLRDIAASRLFLINRAVEMAANAKEDQFENQVAAGVVEAERVLIEKGLTPKEAREMSTFRVFGGVNGNYGTGIQSMVQSGDRWESEEEIADVYLNNMGAFYGSEKNWETVRQFALEAALTRTDAVIQPRQSNTWGALSLDHVYEFMGGMNLAVRNVTGKDPDAYLSDYRNRNNARMQEVKEAIGTLAKDTVTMKTTSRGKREKADSDKFGGMEAMMKVMMSKKKEYSKEEINFALAVMEVERTLKNVGNYKSALLESPERELTSMVNALNGGYTQPSPGGDPIANPNTLPTGRNLFAINAEETPSESAWEKGKQLADNTIEMYRRRHNDSIPRKVSYTLWSGEFIETGGATIAQVLYMLGVEPIRDTFGRVTDLRLIPSAELGRPRIDVVVQTSGQLRDIAASRLFLINRAVEMAANAKEDQFENQVAAGVVEAERVLIEKGLTPKEAREMSTFRVFGGVNGNYGTGIQSMVQSGDRWESEEEIADVYLNNMGAFYGSEKNWETVRQFALEAALTRTDAVIQPRQSNTWGALSLDHVYEFMGGMNLAVRNVTGKDPDAYLSDYRNRNNARMQEVKEAIGIESRTTIFNPAYIKEKMKGEAGAANTFAEIVQNTYGWNVMKPQAVDKEMWNEIYDVYVKDKFNLGVQGYFEKQNPAALEEMTAVMMETIRKGMWQASEQQIADIAKLHTDLVNKYKPSCSGFVCDNAKLRQFIASKTDAQTASRYKENISQIREVAASKEQKGMVMKKEEMNTVGTEQQTNTVSNTVVCVVVVAAVLVLIVLVRCRRKKMQE